MIKKLLVVVLFIVIAVLFAIALKTGGHQKADLSVAQLEAQLEGADYAYLCLSTSALILEMDAVFLHADLEAAPSDAKVRIEHELRKLEKEVEKAATRAEKAWAKRERIAKSLREAKG